MLLGTTLFAVLAFVTQGFAHRRARVNAVPDDPVRLKDLRRTATTPFFTFLFVVIALVSIVSGTSEIVRGHLVGLAYVVPAGLFAACARRDRAFRAWLAAELGDRGTVDRSPRFRRRSRLANGFALTGGVAWSAGQLISAAVGQDRLEVVTTILGGVFVLGLFGYLAIYGVMYVQGDDLDQPT